MTKVEVRDGDVDKALKRFKVKVRYLKKPRMELAFRALALAELLFDFAKCKNS